MIPTKYSNLSNQEVMDKLSQMTAIREDGGCVVLIDPDDASELIMEAQNRIGWLEAFSNLIERPSSTQMSLCLTNEGMEFNMKVKN